MYGWIPTATEWILTAAGMCAYPIAPSIRLMMMAFVLKSTYSLGFSRATENVTITNCEVSGYDEGSFLDGTYKREDKQAYRTGRIKFGTESNGGFKNIAISNCLFDFCQGLALETEDGGLLEDVTISNITMRDITSAPIFLRLGARMRAPQGTPVGELRRVSINNVRVYNADRTFWQYHYRDTGPSDKRSRTKQHPHLLQRRRQSRTSCKTSSRKWKKIILSPICLAPCPPMAFTSAMSTD